MELLGVRVLLVEDDTDTRELLAEVLDDCGAETRTAGDAEEALAELRAWRPDVLVSDIFMPGVDGLAFIRRVREMLPRADPPLPAIALTGQSQERERRQILDAGFQLHLTKPVQPAALVEAIARLAPAGAA